MGIFSKLFSIAVDSEYRDPEYFEELGECDYDCLMCRHRDRDCEGDDDWEYDMMIEEGFFDDEDW